MLMQEIDPARIPIYNPLLQAGFTNTLKAPPAEVCPVNRLSPKRHVALDAVPEIRFDEYRVVRISLARVTFEAVQQVLGEIHKLHGANPQYMFVSAADREAVAPPDDSGIVRRLGRVFQIMNQSTGRLIYQVLLADQEPNTIMFGFFPQR